MLNSIFDALSGALIGATLETIVGAALGALVTRVLNKAKAP